jgi:hypothetical protein
MDATNDFVAVAHIWIQAAASATPISRDVRSGVDTSTSVVRGSGSRVTKWI